MNVFENQLLFMQFFGLIIAFIFPGCYKGKICVVAFGFAFVGLRFYPEVAAA